MEKSRKLIWDQKALIKLEKSLRYISETSIQRADQVEQAILERIKIIRANPELFAPDNTR